jgi:DNA-binding helix-turn-helix protein
MKPYPALLAELLSKELYSLRQQKSLTQEAMAEQLRISSRAYSDLERGKYAASAPTLLFLFSMLEANTQRVLIQQFMKQVQALEGTDAA